MLFRSVLPSWRKVSAKAAMWVDLPAPSTPSKVMNFPVAMMMAGLLPALIFIDRAIMVVEIIGELAAAVAARNEVKRLGRRRTQCSV